MKPYVTVTFSANLALTMVQEKWQKDKTKMLRILRVAGHDKAVYYHYALNSFSDVNNMVYFIKKGLSGPLFNTNKIYADVINANASKNCIWH